MAPSPERMRRIQPLLPMPSFLTEYPMPVWAAKISAFIAVTLLFIALAL